MIEAAFESMRAARYGEIDARKLLDEVAVRSTELPASRHPLGFIHVDLTSAAPATPDVRFRLHIWDRPAGSQDGLGDLHDHVWTLRSLVLLGCLHDTTFVPLPDSEGPYYGSRVVYGAENTSTPELRYRLDVVDERRVEAGNAYEIPSGVVHTSQTLEIPTVTLLMATDDPDLKAAGPLVLSRTQEGTATSVRELVMPAVLRDSIASLTL